jgi:polysaccharide deacetylase family protein (PEP-CTERM system associated)
MSLPIKKVALTFDVELWHEGKWMQPFIDSIPADDTSFENSIDTLLGVLQKKQVYATFFVTNAVVERHPNYIQKIHSAGHEIGSHGIDHERLHDISPEIYEERLKVITQKIAELTGVQPKGFRAPHFSLNEETTWLIPMLKRLGYTYDSSIFPMHMGQYGSSKALKIPYRINEALYEKSTEGFLEFPISVSSFAGISFPYAGGIYFRMLPLWLFKYFLYKEIRKPYSPIIYFHPHELEMKTPRIKKGPRLKRIIKYWGMKRSLGKFEKMLDWYIFDSIENIYLKK